MFLVRASVRAGLALTLGCMLVAAACSSFSADDPAEPTDAGGDGASPSGDGAGRDSSDGTEDASPNACDAGPGTRACDERYLFVTNETLPGDFAAEAGPGMAPALADQFCADQADGQSKYPDLKHRSWRAWVCTTAVSAVGRAATTEARYITPELVEVFPSVAALRSCIPSNPISSGTVWTGCAVDGVKGNADNCQDWTTGAPDASGSTGVASNGDSQAWQTAAYLRCASSAPIYCFEKTP